MLIYLLRDGPELISLTFIYRKEKMGSLRSFIYHSLRIIIGVLMVFVIFYMCSPVTFHYMVSYSMQIISMVYTDSERHKIAEKLSWEMEYKLHEMEMVFNEQWCKLHPPKITKVAWLTAMMNDNYAVGAVYLGYVLRKLSCHHKMIALVSSDVSAASQDALHKVGFDVLVVESLDCNWMDRQKGILERSLGIPGTHMRFHAWNYTQYEKIIYLDGDIMLLNNIDELFLSSGEIAASYCARPGILDPCFNAGLLMFKPSSKSYNEIMRLWSSLSEGKYCPNDQVLLWHYYADRGKWLPLPYAYNVRRYLYHPMKVYHFACCLTKKPWKVTKKPSREDTIIFKGPLTEPQHLIILWWRYFYQALETHNLNSWYDNIAEII